MANAAEMLHLMRHAADLLNACDPAVNALEIDRLSPSSADRRAAHGRAMREVAAIGTASMVLRMVAAAMDDEPNPIAALVETVTAQEQP